MENMQQQLILHLIHAYVQKAYNKGMLLITCIAFCDCGILRIEDAHALMEALYCG